MWPSSDLSLTWAGWFSPGDLCQTPLVRDLSKTAEFGSRFSSGAKQSSSEGRIKLCVSEPFFDGCWSTAVNCWYDGGSSPFKTTSNSNDVSLVVVTCWILSSEDAEWLFLLFEAGDLLGESILLFCSVTSVLLLKISKVCLLSGLTAREINFCAFKKFLQN